MSENPTKIRRSGKIRNRLLIFIVPIVVIMIAALVIIATTLSRKRMSELATSNLNTSISNQADNIESWLDDNLQFFTTAKQSIEGLNPDDAQLQKMLDSYYGFNKNSPEGLHIATADGEFIKPTESALEEKDPTNSTWYKQGLTRVNMQYGTAYKNAEGVNVISASGIVNYGDDTIKVIAADVTLDKISIIVNSGVSPSESFSIPLESLVSILSRSPYSSMCSSALSRGPLFISIAMTLSHAPELIR